MVELGQVLYEDRKGVPRSTEDILPRVVNYVGRTKFTVDGLPRCKFNIASLRYEHKDYSAASRQLFTSREEILERRERDKLREVLWTFFRSHPQLNDVSIDALKQICQLLNIEEC